MSALDSLAPVSQAAGLANRCPEFPEFSRSVFGEWLVLREETDVDGRTLGLHPTQTEEVTRAVRGALLHHAEDPPPAALSGHSPEGRPLDSPHAAFLAVPEVAQGSRQALIGFAILLPRSIDTASREAILDALGRWERRGLRLLLGRAGVAKLGVVRGGADGNLDPAPWTGPSRRWASVTPVALDENPGDLFARDPAAAQEAVLRATQIVARACERIGLPRPASVQVMPHSLFRGAPAAARFMPYPRKGQGFKRVCVHVDLRFDGPVVGPVLLGVGRYFGIGLCRPWADSA